MKKLSIIIIYIYLLFGSLAFVLPQEESIIWSKDHQLTWSDFKGKPLNDSPNGAMSNVGTALHYECKNNLLVFRIESLFYPKKSWVNVGDKIPSTLEHEQLHFDIVEVYSRKLRKIITETKFKGKKFKAQYEELYKSVEIEKDQVQELYDKETTSPRNEIKQKEWLEKIAKELEALESYSNPIIEIKAK